METTEAKAGGQRLRYAGPMTHWKDRAAGWAGWLAVGACPRCGRQARVRILGTRWDCQACIDEGRALCGACEGRRAER